MGHKLAQHGGGTTDSVLFASVFAVFYSLVCSVPHLDVEDIANGYDLCTAAPPVTGLRRTVFAQLQHAVGTGKRARECTGEHGEGEPNGEKVGLRGGGRRSALVWQRERERERERESGGPRMADARRGVRYQRCEGRGTFARQLLGWTDTRRTFPPFAPYTNTADQYSVTAILPHAHAHANTTCAVRANTQTTTHPESARTPKSFL